MGTKRWIERPGVALAIVLTAGMPTPLLAQHARGDASTIEVPLEVVAGRLIVPVRTADGIELGFALSTGNPMTILSESTAAMLGEHAEGLTMGGISVRAENAVTLPDEQLGRGDATIAGMVGGSVLSEYDLLIDVPNGLLLLEEPSTSVSWGTALSGPTRLQILHGVIIALEVKLGGTDYRAQLDLGTPSLIVNPPAGEQLGIEGESTRSLEIGATTMADLPVDVQDLEIFQRWDPQGTGFVLVGAPIAYDCAISISWLHRELRTCTR